MESPKQLTHNGIYKLFFPENLGQRYILQIVGISQDYRGNYICTLSDGHCKVKGILIDECIKLVETKTLELYQAIIINQNDILTKSPQNQPAFQLRKCQILHTKLFDNIGIPIPYEQYKKNNFINTHGSSNIENGKNLDNTITINELLTINGIGAWALKVKVINKPSTMKKSNQTTIDAICYDRVAQQFYGKLQLNKQYLISNANLTRNKKNNKFELKFYQQTRVIPLSSNNNEQSKRQKQQQKQNQYRITPIKDILDKKANISQLVTIAGRVGFQNKIKGGTGIKVIDEDKNYIEVIIWSECENDILQVGKKFLFTNLRIKPYPRGLNLQSTRQKTHIILIEQKQQIAIEKLPIKQNNHSTYNNNEHAFRKKQFIPINLYTVQELTQLQISSVTYKDLYGFLMVKYLYMDQRNFFMNKCMECEHRQLRVNPISCNKCSSSQVSIRLNIKASIIGYSKQCLKVSLNEDLATKLLGLKSIPAFDMYKNKVDQFKSKIQEIDGKQYIFRVKINPNNPIPYYNLLDMYKQESTYLLNKERALFENSFNEYKRIKNLKNKIQQEQQ